MPVYRASVVVEALYIEARNAAEAESKYNHYQSGNPCPEHDQAWDECECIEAHEEVDHDIRLYR